MQMCPDCELYYDASEYPECPYCAGILEYDEDECEDDEE